MKGNFLTRVAVLIIGMLLLAACAGPTTQATTLPTPAMTPLGAAITEVFPLAAGAAWTYDAQIQYADPQDSTKLSTWSGTVTDRVRSREDTLDGRVVFSVEEALTPEPPPEVWRAPGVFEYTVWLDGVYRDYHKVLQWPLSDGLSWISMGGADYQRVATQLDPLETPLGTLAGCYEIMLQTNPDTTIDTFCPQVGFVKHAVLHHGTPQTETFTLTAFTPGE